MSIAVLTYFSIWKLLVSANLSLRDIIILYVDNVQAATLCYTAFGLLTFIFLHAIRNGVAGSLSTGLIFTFQYKYYKHAHFILNNPNL